MSNSVPIYSRGILGEIRWIAYTSDESKRNEVYVRPFPGPGLKQQVSSEGGIEPLWAKDGKNANPGLPEESYFMDLEPAQLYFILEN